MIAADLHCDTLARMYSKRLEGEAVSLRKNSMCVDLEKLAAGDYLIQNFAMFVKLAETSSPFEYCKGMAEMFKSELRENADRMIQATEFSDIERARKDGKIAAVLTAEEGEVYEGSFEKLDTILSYGVKMSTLTWNFENSLAYPNARPGAERPEAIYNTEQGLKPLGFEFVRELERRHVIIDVSHLSDRGFWDVFDSTSEPFCASHSNARAIASHPRNLTDDMLRALATRGGVAGINYFGLFLKDNNPNAISRIEDMIAHIKHMKKIAGIGVIALGSDFDGISGELEMTDASKLPMLAKQLDRAGFTESEVEAIFGGNVLRLYKDRF